MADKTNFAQALSESFPWVEPIYESCLENRRQWKKLAELVDIGLTWIDHPSIDKPIEHYTSILLQTGSIRVEPFGSILNVEQVIETIERIQTNTKSYAVRQNP